MEKRVVETALREGVPFEIETAGGSKIKVSDERNTILRGTYIVVVDEERDCPHVIPLLTMASINYLPQTA